MSRRLELAALTILLLSGGSPVAAEVVLPAVIGDNMVLQREATVAVWGWATPGEQVRVEPGWEVDPIETVAGADGRWQVWISTPAAGGPVSLAIRGDNHITLRNILIGEVWLCPVGLISADWGGTVAQAWMSAESLQAFEAFGPSLELLEVIRDPNRRTPYVSQRVDGWWKRLDSRGPGAGWTTRV